MKTHDDDAVNHYVYGDAQRCARSFC